MSSRVSPGPSKETKAMERFVAMALSFAQGNKENSAAYVLRSSPSLYLLTIPPRWVSSSDQAFLTSGLEVPDFARIPTPKETFGFTQEVIFLPAEEVSHRMDHVKGYDDISVGEDMRENLIENAYKERRLHGSVMEADLVVCVGRKPLTEK